MRNLQSASSLPSLADRIVALVEEARQRTVAAVNTAMVYTYFEIGRQIVEEEQGGKFRARYGERLIRELSRRLTARFGKGFSPQNLANMKKFYLVYSSTEFSRRRLENQRGASQRSDSADAVCKIADAPRPAFVLSWSHYLFLMGMEPEARSFYEREAQANNWSLRELERQFNSSLYERLALSRDKAKILELSKRGQIVERPEDAMKEPYILEFTGLPERPEYSEKELEARLIDHLQEFMLELGKGFCFVGRQVRITSNEDHYHIDLVFYNRLLRSFVLIDLKRAKLRHQDIGQMQMYVNYYDRVVKSPDENPTIGILLCAIKDDFVVEYSLPKDNNQIFARQYRTVLPSKAALKRLVQRQLEER